MAKDRVARYGISRIDDDIHRTHAWRVSLRRQGKAHVKNFPDKKHGGIREALRAARAHRDQLLKKHPPTTRKEFSDARRRNNRSGISGVYRYAKNYRLADGREKESWYWEAHWPTTTGQAESVNFSVNRYGEDLARRLAIRARERGLKQVEGIFWASDRAESCRASEQVENTSQSNKLPHDRPRASEDRAA